MNSLQIYYKFKLGDFVAHRAELFPFPTRVPDRFMVVGVRVEYGASGNAISYLLRAIEAARGISPNLNILMEEELIPYPTEKEIEKIRVEVDPLYAFKRGVRENLHEMEDAVKELEGQLDKTEQGEPKASER